MSRLTLVRHGQASFFADDYDKLSEMGEEQARALAQYWLENDVAPTEVFAGSLQRQRRTEEVVGEVFAEAGAPWPSVEILEGLNEYPADEMMELLLPHLCAVNEEIASLSTAFQEATESTDRYKTFHRLLETVMAEWIGNEHAIEGLPMWTDFHGRVRDALKTILSREGGGRHVAVFTSGGVIGVCVQSALEAPDIKAAELNWRVHNGSLTEFTFSNRGRRMALDAFNSVAHFVDPAHLTFR